MEFRLFLFKDWNGLFLQQSTSNSGISCIQSFDRNWDNSFFPGEWILSTQNVEHAEKREKSVVSWEHAKMNQNQREHVVMTHMCFCHYRHNRISVWIRHSIMCIPNRFSTLKLYLSPRCSIFASFISNNNNAFHHTLWFVVFKHAICRAQCKQHSFLMPFRRMKIILQIAHGDSTPHLYEYGCKRNDFLSTSSREGELANCPCRR